MVRDLTEHPIEDDWYRHAFDKLYPIVYAHRSVTSARAEAQFAAEVLGLRPGDRVLDLCCGNGRHMVHLIEQGARVIGLDYSPDLLGLARQAIGTAALVRGDMRRLPFRRAFDAVVNFFTSFGYFLAPEDNYDVLRGMSKALKPGGRLFLDHMNAIQVARTLTPQSVRYSGDYIIRETRWIDGRLRRVNKTTEVLREGRVVHRASESVQLYSLEEFRALLARGGLRIERVFGDYAGTPFDDDSPRMIVVACRPAPGAA